MVGNTRGGHQVEGTGEGKEGGGISSEDRVEVCILQHRLNVSCRNERGVG